MSTKFDAGLAGITLASFIVEMDIRRILCPTDFSETAAKAGLTVDVEVELGSAVHQILDHAARLPVDMPFRRLLCATDFSEAPVLEWPWHEPPQPTIDELPAEQGFALAMFRRESEERARRQLEAFVPWTQRGVRVAVVSGKPYEQVLAAAAGEGADLIVLGVGRRSALNVAFLGSTANHVVRAAACPVLTLRDREVRMQNSM